MLDTPHPTGDIAAEFFVMRNCQLRLVCENSIHCTRRRKKLSQTLNFSSLVLKRGLGDYSGFFVLAGEGPNDDVSKLN